MSTTLAGDIWTVVNPLISGGLYPLYAPAKVKTPYGVQQTINGIYERDLIERSDMANSHVQIVIWSRDADEVDALALTIAYAMETTPLFDALCINTLDESDPDLQMWGKIVEFTIWRKDN